MTVQCSICGKFCIPADSSTPFGEPTDFEPPEEKFYCKRCAKKEERYYLKEGWVPSDWICARWQRRVAKKLGLLRTGPKGCSWSVFSPSVPKGWQSYE